MAIFMMTIYLKHSKNHFWDEFVKNPEIYPSYHVCDFKSKMKRVRSSRGESGRRPLDDSSFESGQLKGSKLTVQDMDHRSVPKIRTSSNFNPYFYRYRT